MKKEIYILVGPAAIGKTTYTEKAGFPKDKLSIVSRDEVVGTVSEKYNMTYDELYLFPPKPSVIGEYIPSFEKYGKVIYSPQIIQHLQQNSYEYINDVNAEIYYAFYNTFYASVRNPNKNCIVVDRVHMRKEERIPYFKYLENNRQDFVVTAVLFNFKDADTLDVIEQLSEIRKKEMAQTGRFRTVPRHVQENMIKYYEEPTLEEGFDTIIKVDTLPKLRKILNSKK